MCEIWTIKCQKAEVEKKEAISFEKGAGWVEGEV